MDVFARAIVTMLALVLFAAPARAISPVGVKDIEWSDARSGNRPMAMALFYPAKPSASPRLFAVPFAKGLTVYENAEIAFDGTKLPLVMLSHGRGGGRFNLAWFATFLAARGYLVASLDHYKANSYDAEVAYLSSKLWQRPIDIGLDVTYLLGDSTWSKYIDPERIGVAGFSQGGFTALWVGGAKVNPERYAAFQRNWSKNPMLPEHVRKEMTVDPTPALDVADARVKAVFAMAPGVIEVFGFDEAGLAKLKVPTYIIVGDGDTVTPPKENAEFAARYIPGAKLRVLPGGVQHYDFMNECDEESKGEFMEVCFDAPGVDRAKLHPLIGTEAVEFFDESLRGKSGK